jgi:hypothetical protein
MNSEQKSVVEIPRLCCVQNCRRQATVARKLSDFWVSTCDAHVHATLSVNKALEQLLGKKK